MKVFQKFLVVVAITIAASVIAYAAVQFGHLPVEVILIVGAIAIVAQLIFANNLAKQLNAERSEAIEVAGRICAREKISFNPNGALTDIMTNLEDLFRDTLRREKKVVENAADVICLISTDGIIMSANAAAKSVFGYTPEELIGTKLSDYQVAGDGADSLNPLLGADESIQKISIETPFRKKNGSIIDILWSAHWSATDNGLFAVAHDITERKLGEKLLKESEERVRLILESLPAGVCVLGLAGQIIFMNRTALQIIKLTDDQSWKGNAGTVFKPCASPFNMEQFIETLVASPEPKILDTAGDEVAIEVSVRKLTWEDKPVCLVMFIDASEKHAAEKAKQQFIALRQKLMDMVVHDIRSPLGGLLSTHELILNGVGGSVDEKAKSRLQICHDEVKRIVRLLNDLLKISRHEATRLNLSLAETDIESLIAQAVKSIHDLASQKSLAIKVELERSKINADSDRILQVLFNLLSNAIKFSPNGKTITVSSKVEGAFVKVIVADEGEGVPAGAESSIFSPYTQVSWRDSAEKGGTGLGLSICTEIIVEHGGSIGVNNNPSGGASFWFTIPTL